MPTAEEENLIPVTVLGGYLGAGKSTLLNHALQSTQANKLAVIVNDFGTINIDAALIDSRNNDQINLTNGCICCSIGDSLADTLTKLVTQADRVKHIIIEASGVADPQQVASYTALPGLMLDAVLVLVDAEQVQEKSEDRFVGTTVLRQLKGADLLVVNKIDLIKTSAIAPLEAWLASVSEATPVITTSQGMIDDSLLFGDGSSAPGRFKTPHNSELAPHIIRATDENRSPTDHNLESLSFTATAPFTLTEVQNIIAQLPSDILRAKGIFSIEQHTQQVFQRVGRRYSLEPAQADLLVPGHSQLVLIAVAGSIDTAALPIPMQHI